MRRGSQILLNSQICYFQSHKLFILLYLLTIYTHIYIYLHNVNMYYIIYLISMSICYIYIYSQYTVYIMHTHVSHVSHVHPAWFTRDVLIAQLRLKLLHGSGFRESHVTCLCVWAAEICSQGFRVSDKLATFYSKSENQASWKLQKFNVTNRPNCKVKSVFRPQML